MSGVPYDKAILAIAVVGLAAAPLLVAPFTVTLLNYGRVIVDGERDAVIADERTREVYLGT